MKKTTLDSFIDLIMFFYILSLYLFTYREGFNIISNFLAFLLVFSIWIKILLSKRKLLLNNFLIIYFIFIILSSISFFVALDQNIVANKVKTLVLIFLVMISLINYINSFNKIKKIVIYFVISGIIISIFILFNVNFSQIKRYGEEFGNVNAIGMIIGLSATFCFYLILNQKKHWCFLPFSVMIIAIFLTGSRKALLFVLMNILFIEYSINRRSLKKIVKFLVISIIFIAFIYYLVFNIPFFYKIIGKRMEALFVFILEKDVTEDSINERSYMFKVGLKFFLNKPIFGYGLDNYRILYKNVPGGRETYSHNNFIELMTGIGIFGVIFYYITHIIVLKDLLTCVRKTSDKIIYFTFIAIIISYILLSPSFVYYDNKHFSFLLSVASVMNRIEKKSNK